MRGRRPLPSNVVRLRGNPGKRRLNDAEPRPSSKSRLPRLPRRPGQQGVAAAVQGAGRARAAHRPRSQPARGVLPGARALGRGGILDRALRHHDQVAERLPMQSPYVAVANKQVDIMVRIAAEVRHDAHLPHPIRVGDKAPEELFEMFLQPWLLGVPAAAAVDIDILKNAGSEWTGWLKSAHLPDALHGGLGQQRGDLRKCYDDAQVEMKKGGIDLLCGDAKQAAIEFFDQLDRYGVFAVRKGELKSWLPNLGAVEKD